MIHDCLIWSKLKIILWFSLILSSCIIFYQLLLTYLSGNSKIMIYVSTAVKPDTLFMHFSIAKKYNYFGNLLKKSYAIPYLETLNLNHLMWYTIAVTQSRKLYSIDLFMNYALFSIYKASFINKTSLTFIKKSFIF